MSEPRRGGPAKMSDEALDEFLREPRWAALATIVGGELCAQPVWITNASHTGVDVHAAADPGPACVVADIYESYAGIRGAILRGELRDNHLTVARAHGFSFENA